MNLTDYHAKYFAHELTKRCSSDSMEKLAGAVAGAQVDLNPHQVDAALFAFNSPLSKGALIADEVGLGKTIEAGLVISQKWAERKRRILIIVPSNLRKQWYQELAEKFFLPCRLLETKSYNAAIRQGNFQPFVVQDHVVVCSYQLGEHCHTHIIPRLKKVIDGADPGGITEAVGWKGGGGFRYYRLAPSLLEKDKWGNWVISKEFNAAMLAEAVCKLEGFQYAPSDTVYWQHGHSTERDFIYVTTANLNHDQLAALSDEVGAERSLLVVCSAFRGRKEGYANLTVKKIPKAVLSRCEWGHDDYSLQVENLPKAPPKPGQIELI